MTLHKRRNNMIETKPFYTCKYDKAFKEIMMKEENFEI